MIRNTSSLVLAVAALAGASLAPAQQYIVNTIAGEAQVPGLVGDTGAAIFAQFYAPLRIALDSKGNIYVADLYDYDVRMITTSTGVINTVAGTGTPGYSGDGEAATSATMTGSRGIALDSSNNLYIADTANNRIRKVDSSGNINTIAGNGTASATGDGGQATAATVWFPTGLAIDGSNNLYFTDYGSLTVRKIDTSGKITTIAGNGNWGNSGDGGPATKASFAAPMSVAVDKAGNIFIGDVGNNNIRKIDTNGNITTVVTGVAPQSIALDKNGNIFIVDGQNPYIYEVLAGSATVQTIGGNGMTGFGGDSFPATQAAFNVPSGIAVDGSGNLYIADTGNSIIREMTPLSFGLGYLTNSASLGPAGPLTPIAPGEIVTMFGTGMGPANVTVNNAVNGTYPSTLAGVQVTFNSVPAPLLYVSASSIAAIVPYGINGQTANVQLTYQGNQSAVVTVPLVAASPGIFTANSSGSGQAAALNQNGSLNSSSNPAKAGDTIVLYATGEGQLAPFGVDGHVISSTGAPPRPVLPVSVTIGGKSAVVTYAGETPGVVSGLMQINVQVPAGAGTSNVPVVVQVGSYASQTATVALQ